LANAIVVMLAMTSASSADPMAKRDRPIRPGIVWDTRCDVISEVPIMDLATIDVSLRHENRDIYG